MLEQLREENSQMKAQLGQDIGRLQAEVVGLLRRMKVDLDHGTKQSSSGKDILRTSFNYTKQLSTLSESGDYVVNAVELLKSLSFDDINSRYTKIATAHHRTYEWAYKNSFMDWMQSHRQLFWISGKPGSGKSTLIKFLVKNPKTQVCLKNWAGERNLFIASYFFWINGSYLQRSQEGLLRSIVFDILRQRPKLMKNVVHFVRSSTDTTASSGQVEHSLFPAVWTFEKLFEVFKIIMRDAENTDYFCFFIDGLDEYDGDLDVLITFIKTLQAFQNIKLCIASRPWNVFEAAFGQEKGNKIYIQDLTYNDIRLYVQDKLEGHADFQKLKDEGLSTEELVKEVVGKAQGVFLWVHLVVKSLLQGLQNADRVLDLKRRLDAFPADLNAYFGFILNSLDPIYRVQTARGFQATSEAHRRLSVLHFWYLDHEEEDPDYAIKITIPKPYEVPELRKRDLIRTRNMAKRVTGRFKGLLEVTYEKSGRYYLADDGETETMYELQVDFLHRTVKDFLRTKDCHAMIQEWSPSSFMVHESLCKAYVADLKDCCARPECLINRSHFTALVNAVCYSARAYETKTGETLEDLLTELYNVVHYPTPSQNGETLWDLLEVDSFSSFADKHGLKFRVPSRPISKQVVISKQNEDRLHANDIIPSKAPFETYEDSSSNKKALRKTGIARFPLLRRQESLLRKMFGR